MSMASQLITIFLVCYIILSVPIRLCFGEQSSLSNFKKNNSFDRSDTNQGYKTQLATLNGRSELQNPTITSSGSTDTEALSNSTGSGQNFEKQNEYASQTRRETSTETPPSFRISELKQEMLLAANTRQVNTSRNTSSLRSRRQSSGSCSNGYTHVKEWCLKYSSRTVSGEQYLRDKFCTLWQDDLHPGYYLQIYRGNFNAMLSVVLPFLRGLGAGRAYVRLDRAAARHFAAYQERLSWNEFWHCLVEDCQCYVLLVKAGKFRRQACVHEERAVCGYQIDW